MAEAIQLDYLIQQQQQSQYHIELRTLMQQLVDTTAVEAASSPMWFAGLRTEMKHSVEAQVEATKDMRQAVVQAIEQQRGRPLASTVAEQTRKESARSSARIDLPDKPSTPVGPVEPVQSQRRSAKLVLPTESSPPVKDPVIPSVRRSAKLDLSEAGVQQNVEKLAVPSQRRSAKIELPNGTPVKSGLIGPVPSQRRSAKLDLSDNDNQLVQSPVVPSQRRSAKIILPSTQTAQVAPQAPIQAQLTSTQGSGISPLVKVVQDAVRAIAEFNAIKEQATALDLALRQSPDAINRAVAAQVKWEREAAKTQQQYAKLQKSVYWKRLVADQGRLGATLTVMRDRVGTATQGLTIFGNRLRAVGAEGASAFQQAAGYISNFSGAASPDAMAALTGWMRVLTAEFGTMFVPWIAKGIVAIRSATQWWRVLSDETKGMIGKFAVIGTGILGVSFAFKRLAGAGRLVLTVLGGVPKLLTLIAAHPVMAALTGVGALVGALDMKGGDKRDLDQEIGKLVQDRQRLSGGIRTSQDMADLPDVLKGEIVKSRESKRHFDVSPVNTRNWIEEKKAELMDVEAKRDKEVLEGGEINRTVRFTRPGMTGRTVHEKTGDLRDFVKSPDKDLAEAARKMLGDMPKEHDLRIESLRKQITQGESVRNIIENIRGKKQAGIDVKGEGREGGGAAGQFLGGSQANLMSIEQARNSAIEKFLNAGAKPWEQESLRIALDQHGVLTKCLGELTQIKDKVGLGGLAQ